MSGPFPGMDPWLEDTCSWQGVHNAFVVYSADALQPLLGPRYVATLEGRVYYRSVGREVVPDVALRRSEFRATGGSQAAVLEPDETLVLEHFDIEANESYIEIIDLKSDKEAVTVIEVLSPSNKTRGKGRNLYLKKQKDVLRSNASLVEIDLLRSGPHVLAVHESETAAIGVYDYLVAINRSWDRAKRSILYPKTIRERLPRIPIPLRSTDHPPVLDIQSILNRVYESGAFEICIDYGRPCIPRLRPDDEAWAQERIREWQAARSA